MKSILAIFLSLFITSGIFADQPEVLNVTMKSQGNNQYQFDVTLQHSDSGWEHYADKWEILDTEGNILATRVLYHPHVNEQPFTRSLSTTLPDNQKNVVIRGHDKVHKYGAEVIKELVP